MSIRLVCGFLFYRAKKSQKNGDRLAFLDEEATLERAAAAWRHDVL
jgi:hypothetical protein